jgi:hypothetical protein
MHAIRAGQIRQPQIVIDDQRNAMMTAQGLQFARLFMSQGHVAGFFAILDSGHPAFQRGFHLVQQAGRI